MIPRAHKAELDFAILLFLILVPLGCLVVRAVIALVGG